MTNPISAAPCGPVADIHGAANVPTIATEEWNAKLRDIAGRHLTDDETARAEEMGRHGWTLRTVASELFGDSVADQYFS